MLSTPAARPTGVRIVHRRGNGPETGGDVRRGWMVITGAVALLAGCGPDDDVRVQPLPPLERPSPEARAGLPRVAGAWSFAGWELAPGDTARVGEPLPRLGRFLLRTQRLDSIAGAYSAGGGAWPLVGEVRRDGVVALAAVSGELTGFATGRVARDTFWVSLTTLIDGESWPANARAAFVRSQPREVFARVRGARPLRSSADSLRLAAIARDSTDESAADSAGVADTPPADEPPPMAVEGAAARGERQEAPPPGQQVEETRAEEAEEQRADSVTPRPRPRILGQPVRGDTARDTTRTDRLPSLPPPGERRGATHR